VFLTHGSPYLAKNTPQNFATYEGYTKHTHDQKHTDSTYVMTYVPISMLEFLHVHYKDNSIFSTQIRVLEQDPLEKYIYISLWLAVHISIHFLSDTGDTSSLQLHPIRRPSRKLCIKF